MTRGIHVMEEIDIWRTARLLMTQHGEAAGFAGRSACRCDVR